VSAAGKERVQLIHWKAEEAEERAAILRKLGYQVAWEMGGGPAFLRKLRDDPPDAVVIDLSRIPSQGRDMGLALRSYKDTRHVPLVFVGGDPKKVAGVRQLLPDATYANWEEIGSALKKAIAEPPADPVVPDSVMAGYSGAALPKKLGIKTSSQVALVGAPEGFEKTLGKLPDGVVVRREVHGQPDVILWFTKSQGELEAGIERMGALAEERKLWIVWPKKSSGVPSDLTQAEVRRVGLAAGLVDYKVCAVDETWSGLLFTRRKGESQ